MYVGNNPWKTIGASVFCSVICMSGFSQFYTESRSDRLWIPQGTDAKDEETTYNSYFPRSGAMSYMYIEPKSGR